MPKEILSENKNCQNYLSSSISDINSEPYLFTYIDHPRSLTKPPGLLQVDGATDLLSPPGNNLLPFTCVLCTLTFTSAKLLDSHFRHIHDCSPSAFKCHICDNVCENANDFLVHIETLHSRCQNLQLIIVYKCLTCEYETGCEDDLKNHIETVHIQSPVVACEFCDLSFNDSSNLKNHITLFHSNSSQDYQIYPWLHPDLNMHVDSVNHLQNIPQVDGPNQELYHHNHCCEVCCIFFPCKDDLERHFLAEHFHQNIPQVDGINQDLFEFSNVPPLSTTRVASFALNQTKQMMKIKEDALLNDYEVTINNSDQNVTIKCSSGFYIQVGKSCFVTLEKRSVLSKTKIAITMDEVTKTKDKNGLESTSLMNFSIMSELARLGGVAVHLHHSSRTIQIQGSSMMPDSTRAAVWFLNNLVLSRFKDIAKTKKFVIKSFNEAARSSSVTVAKNTSTGSNSCHSCNVIFSLKAKPSKCMSCLKFFHKLTCLKEHVKHCKKPSISSSTRTPSSVSLPVLSSQTRSTVSFIPGVQSSISFVPPPNVLPLPPSSSRLETSQSSGLQPTLIPDSNPTPVPGLPTPLPTVPSASLSSSTVSPLTLVSTSGTSAPKTNTKSGGKKKQKSVPVNEADHSIELLQKELSATQTKIVLLDSQIKDKDNERAVLYARIKILEEKQNSDILDKYFPLPNTSTSKASQAEKSSPEEGIKPLCSACSSPRCSSCSNTSLPRCCSQSSPCPTSTSLCSHVSTAIQNLLLLIQPPCHNLGTPCQHQDHSTRSQASNQESNNVLKREMETISLTINQLKSDLSTLKNLQVAAEDPSNPRRNPVTKEQEKPVDPVVDPSSDLNASIATVEEFMDDNNFDVPACSSNQLN